MCASTWYCTDYSPCRPLGPLKSLYKAYAIWGGDHATIQYVAITHTADRPTSDFDQFTVLTFAPLTPTMAQTHPMQSTRRHIYNDAVDSNNSTALGRLAPHTSLTHTSQMTRRTEDAVLCAHPPESRCLGTCIHMFRWPCLPARHAQVLPPLPRASRRVARFAPFHK